MLSLQLGVTLMALAPVVSSFTHVASLTVVFYQLIALTIIVTSSSSSPGLVIILSHHYMVTHTITIACLCTYMTFILIYMVTKTHAAATHTHV